MPPKPTKSGPAPPPPLLLPSRKYGAPLYGAAWPEGSFVYVCGGGGSASSGIKNRLVFFECKDGQLTDQVGEHHFGQDCPMRLTISPDGKCILLAMGQGGIRRLLLDTRGEVPKVTEPSDELANRLASDIKEEVRCMAFSPSSQQLALGGVDGTLRVVDWPSMQPRLTRIGPDKLKDGVRDVDMAPGSRTQQVAVVLDNGRAEIWDWGTGQQVCHAGLARGDNLRSDSVMIVSGPGNTCAQRLPKALHGAQFTRLRYATSTLPANQQPQGPGQGQALSAPPAGPPNSNHQVSQHPTPTTLPEGPEPGGVFLYALMNNRSGCFITVWGQQTDTGLLALRRWRKVGDVPGACLDVSRDGRHLAVGTSEGAAMVLSSATLSVVTVNPKAHMVFSTGIYFAADSKHALSISADASATVLKVAAPPRKGGKLWRTLLLFFILAALCAAAFLFMARELEARGYQQFSRERLWSLARGPLQGSGHRAGDAEAHDPWGVGVQDPAGCGPDGGCGAGDGRDGEGFDRSEL